MWFQYYVLNKNFLCWRSLESSAPVCHILNCPEDTIFRECSTLSLMGSRKLTDFQFIKCFSSLKRRIACSKHFTGQENKSWFSKNIPSRGKWKITMSYIVKTPFMYSQKMLNSLSPPKRSGIISFNSVMLSLNTVSFLSFLQVSIFFYSLSFYSTDTMNPKIKDHRF
jgi:hypothetical protein